MSASPSDDPAGLDVPVLLSQLSLEEKASLCLGSDFWHTAPVQRLGIPSVMMTDGPHGLRKEEGERDDRGTTPSLPATCFPPAASLASSWDRNLLRDVGVALGREARAQCVSVLLGPGVNIKRSPLCGRNFEYLSEDPRLAGELATALVDGLQSQGVGASLKHFAANNQETDRARVSADVDERTLREIYLPAFERVVTEAQPWTVMCAYNKLNGVYASQHHWLLTEVLRDEWGFEGLVVSDWGAVHDRPAAVAAGLDLEMPPQLGWSDRAVVEAVRSGALDEQTLDETVGRVLALVDRSRTTPEEGAGADLDAHHELAREAARRSAVLLKNDGVLPLSPRAGQRVAVVGELARTPRFQGAGSSQVNPTRVDVPLDELRAAVPDGVQVDFAPGYRLGAADDASSHERLTQEAVALVHGADEVLVFIGLPETEESEGFDRRHPHLPLVHQDLVAALARVHDRVVVVLANGGAVLTAPWEEHASAVLECWLGGQGGGRAVADLLLGVASPSGRLAETIPLAAEHVPAYLTFPGEEGHVRYGEGVFVGYRGYQALTQPVSYPFGHGLTYTSFEYGAASVEVSGRHDDDTLALRVTCRVTNTGRRAGREVAQLYVHDQEASLPRPPWELRGFVVLDLEPGRSAEAVFDLTARDLSFWSAALHDWVLEAGTFELAVGGSSADLGRPCTAYVEAPARLAPLGAMSSLQEWVADPDGFAALQDVLGRSDDGGLAGPLGSAELQNMVGNFPISMLAGFGTMGLDHPTLQRLVAELGGSSADDPDS